MPKRFAEVSESYCVSCGACMSVCPKGAIKIVKGCYAFVDRNFCVGCGICARTCPAGAIEVKAHEVA